MKNNLIINEKDNLFVHRIHLEKLLRAKPHVQNKGPEMPYFMKNKLSIKHFLRSNEQKRFYENAVIFSRLLKIDNSISDYGPENKPIYCAAFDRKKYNFDKTERMRNTQRENSQLFTRLIKQKTYYPIQDLLNANYFEKRLKKHLLKQKFDNPNINFATFSQFKKNLVKKLKIKKSHSVEYIEPSYLDERYYNYNYINNSKNDTELIDKNNCCFSYAGFSAKSFKDNINKQSNNGCLSTMITTKAKVGKDISRCQSAFMKKQNY